MSPFAPNQSGRAALALEGEVAQAGCAMACSFSSSDELYAAMIDARRASGAYGRRRGHQYLAVGAGIAVLVAAILIVV